MSHRLSRTISGANMGINVFGMNAIVHMGFDGDLWSAGGVWVGPTAARIHSIVSVGDDAADDDFDGGDGARTVLIEGLDFDGNQIEEVIELSGEAPVNTTLRYWRINFMDVLKAGSTHGNMGTITATAAVDGTITNQIPIGMSQAQSAIYTVPVGYDALLKRYFCELLATPPPTSSMLLYVCTEGPEEDDATIVMCSRAINGGHLNQEHSEVMPSVTAKTTIVLRAHLASELNMMLTGGFELIFIPTGA